MCGFVGVLCPTRQDGAPSRNVLSALRRLAHRGPDGQATFASPGLALGAGRLAIQGDARADQPVRSADGRFVLVFNGELLAPEAQRLRRVLRGLGGEAPPLEAGDTSLLAEAAAALAERSGSLQGPWLLELLEGAMGAFALLDLERDEVWLVRDRLGIKPLHVACEGESVWFASEIKPLLEAVPAARSLEPAGLAELLCWQRPVRHLPFAGVESLRPGAVWRVRRGARITRWVGGQGIRDLAPGDGPSEPEVAVRDLATAWRDSARSAAAIDSGTVMAFLSGGLDSGAVVLWAGRGDLLALTGRFCPVDGPLDESRAAAQVARVAGIRHEVVDLDDADLVRDLPAVVTALELPMAGPGALALWRLARTARDHGVVVLSGTGGDELLGGYVRTALVLGRQGSWTARYEPLARRLDDAGEGLAARQRAALDRSSDLRPFLDPGFFGDLEAATEPPGCVAHHGAPAEGAVAELVAEEVEGTLPSLLHVEDRVLMAHGLEGRPVPCLGGVPRAAAQVPPDWLVGPDGEGKRALRAALAGIMPDRVRLDPTKRGFPTPFSRAVRGPARRTVAALFDDRRFLERGWWNVAACRAALDEDRPVFDRGLYALLSWEFWARAFLDGDAFASESDR